MCQVLVELRIGIDGTLSQSVSLSHVEYSSGRCWAKVC